MTTFHDGCIAQSSDERHTLNAVGTHERVCMKVLGNLNALVEYHRDVAVAGLCPPADELSEGQYVQAQRTLYEGRMQAEVAAGLMRRQGDRLRYTFKSMLRAALMPYDVITPLASERIMQGSSFAQMRVSHSPAAQPITS